MEDKMTIKTTIRSAITMNSLILVRTRVWLFFFGRIRGEIVQNQMTTGNRSFNSGSAVAKSLQKMTSGGILGEERKRGK